ncbi:MAG: hypothetical protein LQ343_001578 [Gyalolechia ehrenbergii]|nr:MAG: hypothetical protein LQ343_001578 [Gyalolechia ehrenbergii]
MTRTYALDLERGTPRPEAPSHHDAIKNEKQPHNQPTALYSTPPRNHDTWVTVAKLIYIFILFGLGYLLGCGIVRGLSDLAQMISAGNGAVGEEFREWMYFFPFVFPQLDPAAPNQLDGASVASMGVGKG